MKKRQGYSLSLDERRILAVGISAAEETPYRLDWVEETPAEARRRVVLDLPNDQVHLLTTSLPAMKARALGTAVQGVVTRKQGGKPGDWIARHTLLPGAGGKGGSRDYAVVFAARALVQASFAAALEHGCRAVGMLPDFLALDEMFRRHGIGADDSGPWNLVHLGEDERFLCVGDEHGLLFSRPLPEDLSGGTERDEYLQRLATEIERSCFFAQQAERSMIIGRIVLCGRPDLADDLAVRLGERSEIEIRRWRPEELFTSAVERETWPLTLHLARAVSALHGPACELLPPGAKPNPVRKLRRQAAVAMAALVTVAVPILLVGGVLTSRVQQEFLDEAADRLGELDMRAGQAATDYLQNRALRDRQENVDRLVARQPDLAGLLAELAERTPPGVTYGALELERDAQERLRLTLRGESLGRTGDLAQELFLDFHGRLAASGRLQETREPVYLEIAGVEDSQTPQSRVAFTLEYLVRTEEAR